MKRFVLNKVKVARLINLQTIRGGVDTPAGTSILVGECTDTVTVDCITDDCTFSGTAPCTLTSIQGELTTNPVGPDTLPL